MSEQGSREKRETKAGWWTDENHGKKGKQNMSQFNRRQQKRRLMEESNQERCPGPAFCDEIYCDYCGHL